MFLEIFYVHLPINNCLCETVFQYSEHSTTLLKIFPLPYKINKLKIFIL